MIISGIYQIQSKCYPKRTYIGSAVNIYERWRLHLLDLRKDRHSNNKLQNHFNKYGELDLVFSVLLGCNNDELINNEQFFMDCNNPYFNICKKAGSRLGIKHSEETKRKLSDLLKGRPSTTKGKKLSKEHRRKLSKSHIGQVVWNKGKTNIYSEETLKRMSEKLKNHKHNLGKHHSNTTKQKISNSLKGREPWNKGKHTGIVSSSVFKKGSIPWSKTGNYSEESKKKMSNSHLGKSAYWNIGLKRSDETKKKISDSIKRNNERKRVA